mmetsp:Transcript_51715/g.123095  ORF Transcript_51715/g.123095 Transcript_51715/m.123095 type:complete len:151 (+) Transcript_51715:89-541(+)
MPAGQPFPGESPETIDTLREECAMLRQRIRTLEAEKSQMNAVVKEWRRWYTQHYRPQMEFLEGEVSRLCSLAPVFDEDREIMNRSMQRTGTSTSSMKRNRSLPEVGRRVATPEEMPSASPARSLVDRGSPAGSQKIGSRAAASSTPVRAR